MREERGPGEKEKRERKRKKISSSLSSPSLPDLSSLLFFSSFFLSFLPLLFSFLSLLRSAAAPTSSGEPGDAPRRGMHQASGPARDAPRRADQARRTRRDPGRPTGTSPVQARQLRNLSWTASARAVLFATTLFRQRFFSFAHVDLKPLQLSSRTNFQKLIPRSVALVSDCQRFVPNW